MATDLHLPHQLPQANKTLTAQCHCKSVHFTVTVPTSALPLPVHLCHCSICRYVHGTFCSFHAPLPHGLQPEFVAPSSIESSLTRYIHSPLAAAERFFCSTCGCHIGDRDLKPDPATGKPEWRVATSIFASHDEDTFQIRTHTFTRSAPEPNLATWLPTINSRAIHIWNPAPNDPKFPLASVAPPRPQLDHAIDGPEDDDVLIGQCHCSGVRFTLPRPSAAEAADPRLSRFLWPEPDPSSNSSSPPAAAAAAAAAAPRLKRVACVCVCADCRLVTGAHALPWTFAPLAAIRPRVPRALEGLGTLRAYRSSERVTRAFCRVCGATVFYALDDDDDAERGLPPSGEGGGRIVDVAVGVLRDPKGTNAGEGVALDGWLAWRTGRLAWAGAGREYDAPFAEALAKGLSEWGLKRYGEVVDFDIPRAPVLQV